MQLFMQHSALYLNSPVMYYPGYDFVGRRTKWLEGTQAANAAFVGNGF